MALRPRKSSFRTQPSSRPSNEDFQPNSEMKENQEAHILQILLPGFTKERIKIIYEGSSRTVKVSGERPIHGGRRWSRFKQDFPVPTNCESERIQSKFNQGILTITMPKKLISQATPKVEVKTTQEKAPSPPMKVVPEKTQETIPQKSATSRAEEPREKKSDLPSSSVRDPAELKAEKGQEDTSAQRPVESQKPEKGKEEIAQKPKITMAASEKKTDDKPEKVQEETVPKPTMKMSPKKPVNEYPQKGQEEIEENTTLTSPKKQAGEKTVGTKDEDAEKEMVSQKEVKEAEVKPSESKKPEEGVVKGMVEEKEIRARKELSKGDEHSAPETPEREKETTSKAAAAAANEETHNDGMIDTIGKAIQEVAASASQVFTRIAEGKWDGEDKPLLVNMGASVLVIATVGAYAFYRIAYSR